MLVTTSSAGSKRDLSSRSLEGVPRSNQTRLQREAAR
jgi:hypothetical protein